MADEIAKITDNPEQYGETVSIDKLVKVLQTLSEYYYNTDNPLIPDSIFDILYDALLRRDPTNTFLKKVGAKVKNAVKLPYYMPSLDKIKPTDKTNTLESWIKIHPGEYLLSDKLDGISGLFIKNGKKLKLFTRGDGIEGQDISNLIKYVIKTDTNKLPNIAIRGEMIMSKKNFQKIKDKFKNARNAVAGIVNSKTYQEEIAILVEFIGYNVFDINGNVCEQMKILKENKFPCVSYKTTKNINTEILSSYFIERRKNSEYEIDGIVVADCSKSYEVSKENPKHSFAFKMMLDDQKAITTVKEVEWNLSKDGYYKPRILLEPIELVGVTVKYATAFNAKYVNDNKLGPGAIVEIIRSGDVIPYILKVIKPADKPQMPEGNYKWNATGVDLVNSDKISNNDIIIKKLTYFFKTLDVKNMGEGIITKLVENGYKTVVAILSANKEDLSKIDGLGDKSIDKIYDNMIESFNTSDLATLMGASGLFGRGMGVKRLNLIVDKYPNILSINLPKDKYLELIKEIDGFDTITATQFVDNIDKFKIFLGSLEKINIINIKHLKEVNKKNKGELFLNKKIVLTGFRGHGIDEFITKNGGTISSSVSKNTDLIIYADGETQSSKYLKAKELNIQTISLSEFENKYKLK